MMVALAATRGRGSRGRELDRIYQVGWRPPYRPDVAPADVPVNEPMIAAPVREDVTADLVATPGPLKITNPLFETAKRK